MNLSSTSALSSTVALFGVLLCAPSAASADSYTAGANCVGMTDSDRQDLDFKEIGIVNTDSQNSAAIKCPAAVFDYTSTSHDYGTAVAYLYSHNTTAITCTFKARTTSGTVLYTAQASSGTDVGYRSLPTGAPRGNKG